MSRASTVFILSLHGVGEPRRSLSSSEQRHWLGLDQFEQFLGLAGRRNDLRLTFDDGNESDFTIALPALVKRGLTAGFFITADRLGQPGFLSRAQVPALAGAGMTVGSHGHRHVPLRQLSSGEIRQDLERSRLVLEELVGSPVTALALPYGDYDRRVLACARATGYQVVLTTDRGPARPGAWLQSRTTVYASDDVGSFESCLAREARGRPAFIRRLKCLVKRLR